MTIISASDEHAAVVIAEVLIDATEDEQRQEKQKAGLAAAVE
jgi:hypothetical protein